MDEILADLWRLFAAPQWGALAAVAAIASLAVHLLSTRRRVKIIEVWETHYDDMRGITLTTIRVLNPGGRYVHVDHAGAEVKGEGGKRELGASAMVPATIPGGSVHTFKAHFAAPPDDIKRVWIGLATRKRRHHYYRMNWPLRKK